MTAPVLADPALAFDPQALDAATGRHVRGSLEAGERDDHPYRHWYLGDVFPPVVAEALSSLPFAAPEIDDTLGRRETHNSTRTFLAAENQAMYPVCGAVAAAFQAPETVATITRQFGVDLSGSSLRIEYCLDREGFWLESHTDIGAKLFTMLVYLSTGPDAEKLGTDIMDGPNGGHVGRASGRFNTGLVFIPGTDTWHGFARRPFRGIRRTIIINYVKPEWRARHELAFPEQPV
ncbi:2OG-Fe(II) oxygenase [Azospirillum sp. B4]|uniref:2OG-Fe(II) oxygenase n=1 Tax=Azospirillum sp. B4 TaxID=95605 RepID=UPI0020787427|nr:2OG-Fe(II) oxygenase [Azospirillum sp. B4]